MRRLAFILIVLLAASCLGAETAGVIRGTVYSESGASVGDAAVILVRGAPSMPGEVIGESKTGPSGEFTIAYPAARPSSIRTGLYFTARTNDLLGIEVVRNPNATQRIVLHKRAPVSGVVRDPEGSPIERATVSPDFFVRDVFLGQQQVDYSILHAVLAIQPAKTDAQGRFTINGLPDGWQVALKATKDGYESPPSQPSAPGSADVTLILKASSGAYGTIKGRLLDENTDEPVCGIRVTAVNAADPETGEAPIAATGPDGSFEFRDLPPGTYAILAVEADKPVEPEEIEVLKGETAQVTIYAVEGTPIQGRVVDQTGKGIPALLVISPGSRPAVTDGEGRFSVRMLPGPGVLAVVDNEGRYSILNHQLEVPEEGTVEGLDLKVSRSTRIQGRALDPAGKPIDGALIRVLYHAMPGETVQADSQGKFNASLDGSALRAGAVRVVAYDEASSVGATVQIEPALGADTRTDLRLEPTHSISGLVKSDDGKPVPNARITPLVDAGQYQVRSLNNATTSDDSGKYVLTALIPGLDYALRIEAKGYSPLHLPKLPPNDEALVLNPE